MWIMWITWCISTFYPKKSGKNHVDNFGLEFFLWKTMGNESRKKLCILPGQLKESVGDGLAGRRK